MSSYDQSESEEMSSNAPDIDTDGARDETWEDEGENSGYMSILTFYTHFLCTMAEPDSSNSFLEIHMS